MTHRWASPFHWLNEKMHEWTAAEVRNALHVVAASVDYSTLQDIFQREMDEDGYFEEVVMVFCPGSGLKDCEDCNHRPDHALTRACSASGTTCPPCQPTEVTA